MGDPRRDHHSSCPSEQDETFYISPERFKAITELLFAAKELAEGSVRKCRFCPAGLVCKTCGAHSLSATLIHINSCPVARLAKTIESLLVSAEPIPVSKEVAQTPEPSRAEAGTPPRSDFEGPLLAVGVARIAACVKFCEGIPTEVLESEKPLGDLTRDIGHQFMLRRVLPGLPGFPADRRAAVTR